jgi:hypothetical protein
LIFTDQNGVERPVPAASTPAGIEAAMRLYGSKPGWVFVRREAGWEPVSGAFGTARTRPGDRWYNPATGETEPVK